MYQNYDSLLYQYLCLPYLLMPVLIRLQDFLAKSDKQFIHAYSWYLPYMDRNTGKVDIGFYVVVTETTTSNDYDSAVNLT